jgi:hypothetical protein
MKIVSFNLRGLANPSKKSSLRRMVDNISPGVILLQETLGIREDVKFALESLLHGWVFVAVDSRGRSVLAYGWKSKVCRCDNVWNIESGIGLELYAEEMGRIMAVINIYGPYLDRVRYWESLLNNTFMEGQGVISLLVWQNFGAQGLPNTLSIFFIHAFEQRGLLDIEPNKLNLTWRNRRNGDGRVAKRLDRFLVVNT